MLAKSIGGTFWILSLFLLCQCAAKHQPRLFPPYYATAPEPYLTEQLFSEIRALEAKGQLNVRESKRLFDLYQLELRGIKPSSERHQWVTQQVEKLRPLVAKEASTLAEVQGELIKRFDDEAPPPPKFAFKSSAVKKAHQEVYLLWNSDQNEAALKKLDQVLADSNVMDDANREEKFKLLMLRFRVLSDLSNLEGAIGAYQALNQHESCHQDTNQAGFVLSLALLGANDAKRALEVFSQLCEEGEDKGNRLRNKYWGARIREAASGEKVWSDFFKGEVPGYYIYLASRRAAVPLVLTNNEPLPMNFINQEFPTSGYVSTQLKEAEDRLQFGLRRDAALYLRKVLADLGRSPNDEERVALFYTAQLLHAAGDHLGALRIYAILMREITDEDSFTQSLRTLDFVSRMFPRPYGNSVDWLARSWNLDADFVYSIMRQESGFNPGAVSRTNARGLMQIMPQLGRSLAERWGSSVTYSDKLLFRADENLRLASFHLRYLIARAPHLALVAASYNAGLNRVSGWWRRHGQMPLDIFVELIPVAETRDYVKLVLRNYVNYRLLRNGGTLDIDLFSTTLPPPPPLPVLMQG